MAGKDLSKRPADDVEMSAQDAADAIAKAASKEPQLAALRDKLIQAIERTDGGMEQFVRVIRAKLHEG